MGCDSCRKYPFSPERFKVGIAVKTYVRPIVRFKLEDESRDDDFYAIAYGPFTEEHARKQYLGYYVCYDPEVPKTSEDYLRYETIDRVWSHYPMYVSWFHEAFGIDHGAMCVNCGFRYVHWFKADGTPTEKLQAHVRYYFWDDPEPRMWFTVDGKDVTRDEFWEAWCSQ